jgi:hypothetical protein
VEHIGRGGGAGFRGGTQCPSQRARGPSSVIWRTVSTRSSQIHSTSGVAAQMHHRNGIVTRGGLIAAVALIVCGCPGMAPKDNARFQSEVAQKVAPGMPLATARQHLVKAAFSCDDDTSAAPDITCTRSRAGFPLYGCIQRVILAADSDRSTVTAVTPRPIACTGL